MKILEGKRLAAIFAAYAGIFSCYVLVPSMRFYTVIGAAIVLAVFFIHVFLRERPRSFTVRKWILLVLMIASLLGGMLRGAYTVEKTEKTAEALAGGNHAASGYVTEVHYEEPYGSSYAIVLQEIDGKPIEMGAVLTIPYAAGLSRLDGVAFEGEFLLSDGEYALYRKADGIWLDITCEGLQKTEKTEKPFDSFFENIRDGIREIFHTRMGDEAAGFATALLTGDRDEVSGATRLAFTRLGISHLLAVSGLHLTIVVGGADVLMRILTVPKKKKNLLLIAVSFFFACVCGLSASILRAAIMLSLYYLSDTLGERSDSVTALFFALFAILFCQPRAVLDVGLWLSFLSTFGILSVMPTLRFSYLEKLPRIPKRMAQFLLASLGMTVSATFFTMPVTYLAFGGLSLVSPITNLVFVPIIQLLLYVLVLATVLCWMPVAAPFLFGFAEFLITHTLALTHTASDIKNIYVSLRYPFVLPIILLLVIGILAVLWIKKWHPAVIFAVFFGCIVIFGTSYGIYHWTTSNEAYLYLQTDGKSDAVGIVSEREVMLIDITTGGAFVPTETYRHLADFYECEVDAYVLTHYHRYHANMLRKLSENIKIHRLLMPTPLTENDMKYCEAIVSVLEGHMAIEFYEAGTETVGEMTVALPERRFLKRSEHPVITFSGTMASGGKGFSYLSSSATELDCETEAIVFFGSHGPVAKHIFDAALLDGAELAVFAEKETASFTETERIGGELVFAEEYGGYLRIAFVSDD